MLLFAFGLLLMLLGLAIMVQTIGAFIWTGKGTLAPWSPPNRLITSGLYAYVRNPMILGVIIMLLGEAIAVWSGRILGWAAIVFLANTIYFTLSEEPGLERRFGAEYRRYKESVPRWIPRFRKRSVQGTPRPE